MNLGIRRVPRCGAWVSICVLVAAPGLAADWSATEGELGRAGDRLALHIGASYAALSGSEVARVDPGPGFEAGITVKAVWSLSVVGSIARNQSDVKGQLTQLLDQIVRPSGRSATVDGKFTTTRFRAGVRVDALRERNWRFQPYLAAAVVFSKNEVELNSVNGQPPPIEVPGPPPDFATKDISTFSDTQIGGLGRFGVEWAFSPRMAADLNASYEVLEFPSGTNALSAINGALVFRI